MLVLSEELEKWRGASGMRVRKAPPHNKRSERCYVVVSFGVDVLIKAGLCDVVRLDAYLESESIMFFEPTLPGAGWALGKPKKNKSMYFKIPYKKGLPFILDDNERYKLKELTIDPEKKTITVSTRIEKTIA